MEAVRALLPDWWLVHPTGPGQVAALAAAPPPRTVVWLDELQRYLDGEHGLTGGLVRALLGPPGLVVIIGTLWPDRYAAYTACPAPAALTRTRGNARCWTWPRSSASARSSARRSRTGPAPPPPVTGGCRSRLEAAGYGLTQTLAAAPQLVARWEDARAADPYAWAVLTAALDAARLGARAPLSAEFLRAAAPGYCTGAQQAEAPDNWFEQALAYATEKLHGAAAALTPPGPAWARSPGTPWRTTCSSTPAGNAGCARARQRLGRPAQPRPRPRRRRPPRRQRQRVGCCTATPSRCTGTPPTPATGTPPTARQSADRARRSGRGCAVSRPGRRRRRVRRQRLAKLLAGAGTWTGPRSPARRRR